MERSPFRSDCEAPSLFTKPKRWQRLLTTSSSSTEATTSLVAPRPRRPHTADLGDPHRWKSTPLDAPPSQTTIANAYARKASASTAEKESTPPPNALKRNLDPESMPSRKPPPSREKRKLRRP